MNYETVYLEDKTVAGFKVRTRNSAPDMTEQINGLWQQFFEKAVYQSIPDKLNGKSIGLYTNYESGVNGAYDMMVCYEVQSLSDLPADVYTQTIPAGTYAKFVVKGDV